MRIFRRPVNPHWGTVNRPLGLRPRFFCRRRRTVARLAHAQQASSGAASGSSYIETAATAHLLRYIVTECKHIA